MLTLQHLVTILAQLNKLAMTILTMMYMVTLSTIKMDLVDSDVGLVHCCLLPSIILANHCTVDPVGHPHALMHMFM